MCSTVRACLSAAVPVYDGQGYAARLAISCFHSYKYTSVIVSTRTQFRVYIYIYIIYLCGASTYIVQMYHPGLSAGTVNTSYYEVQGTGTVEYSVETIINNINLTATHE